MVEESAVADAMVDATLVLRALLLLYSGPQSCCASACVARTVLSQPGGLARDPVHAYSDNRHHYK